MVDLRSSSPVPPTAVSALDRFALTDLVARYAHAMDDRDVAAAVALFTDDAVLRFVSSATELRGRAAIAEFYSTAFERRPALGAGAVSTHVMSNTVVTAVIGTEAGDGERDGEVVSLLTHGVAYLAVPGDDDRAASVTVRGLTYADRCVRGGSGWLFAERTHRLHWQGAMPGGPRTTEEG